MVVSSMSLPRRRSPKTKWVFIGLAVSSLVEVVLAFAVFGLGRGWVQAQPEKLPHPLSFITRRLESTEVRPMRASTGSTRLLSMTAALTRYEQWLGGRNFAGIGHSYALVHVIASNQGSESVSSDLSAFVLVDAEQQTHTVDPNAMAAIRGTWPEGPIGPRERTGGYVVFRVPSSAQGLVLTYLPPGQPEGTRPIRIELE
jgi:hypothetical protein